jgi:holo-[acyl-carrier protein] synthase
MRWRREQRSRQRGGPIVTHQTPPRDDRTARNPGRPTPILRIGTDLCSVEQVAQSVATFGDRYLRRVYTDEELVYCRRDPALSAERLAARFAAKEATVKVLRPRDLRPDWRTIEVRRDPDGWCELALTGSAARLAQEAAIGSLSVSLSHDAGMANAVVIATLLEQPDF